MTGPGKSFRKGLSIPGLAALFPDNDTAEEFLAECRWEGHTICPHCGSHEIAKDTGPKRAPYGCKEKDCGKQFSVKTKTVMHNSKLDYRTWVFAVYLMTTNLKGVSSLKLHRDLGITQRIAWYLAHRIRTGWERSFPNFEGPVETDETFIEGKERNKHFSERHRMGRGTAEKITVAGILDRKTNLVQAKVVDRTNKRTLQGNIRDHVQSNALLYTVDWHAYRGMRDYGHDTVRHSTGQYVKDMTHTNSIESFWSVIKRA